MSCATRCEFSYEAEQRLAADCLQPPLRSGFRQQLKAGVDMIDIANGCAKRTYKSDFWRNRCVNHHYFLICTQGKSEGLGAADAKGFTLRGSLLYPMHWHNNRDI